MPGWAAYVSRARGERECHRNHVGRVGAVGGGVGVMVQPLLQRQFVAHSEGLVSGEGTTTAAHLLE
eukprot:4324095-Pyramimonas_sp.AAC.1